MNVLDINYYSLEASLFTLKLFGQFVTGSAALALLFAAISILRLCLSESCVHSENR